MRARGGPDAGDGGCVVRLCAPPRGSRRCPPRCRHHRSARPRPWGSRFGDVIWARIVRGVLARIERGRISSRWARMARGGMDFVALTWHYASRARPTPARESAGSRLGVVADPVPVPAPSRPASAGSARSSLNPRERLLEVRARGLGDDLGGYPAISRPGDTPGAAGSGMWVRLKRTRAPTPDAAGSGVPTPAREINTNERTGAGMRTRTDPAARTTTGPRSGAPRRTPDQRGPNPGLVGAGTRRARLA